MDTETIIAINSFIADKERLVNEVFIKEANRIWDKGEGQGSYPAFVLFYTDLLWKDYLRLN